MPQLLTLLRAARLIGVSRGALQSKVKSGELATFEGLVSAEDLLRAYPQIKLENDTALERIEQIKDTAFAKRMRERLLPNSEVLIARLTEMGKERAQAQAQLDYYRTILEQLLVKLREFGKTATSQTNELQLLDWLTQNLETIPHGKKPQPLLAQDNFLRIMTAHVKIQPSGREFFVDGNDSLLEAALRAGMSLDYGCSIGSCGKCKARILSGKVQKTRHSDYAFTEAEKNSGVVLMCCNTALVDLVIEAREAHGAVDMPLQKIETKIKSISPIAEDMRLLHLQTPRTNRLRFLAGQSVLLGLPGGSSASFAVASCPCDDRNLQFHIRQCPGNDFAERVFNELKSGDSVLIEGPHGEFALNEESHRPLIFIACDTGFAPIKSLIEHAMALDAADTLNLYWIASAKGHYLDNLCRSWSDALDNFRYVPISAAAAMPDDALMQLALRQVLQDHPRLDDYDVYIAGPGPWANAVEFQLLDHGLPRTQLFVNALQS